MSAPGPDGGGGLKRALTVLVGFLHDFAAGIWAACTFAIWWLERALPTSADTVALTGLQWQFFYIALACVAAVLLAGAGRTFTYSYVGAVYGEEAEAIRRRMLIAKHLVLFFVFGLGTWWQYVTVRG